MAAQDLRSFVAAFEHAHPREVIRVADPVTLEEDVMALVLEYERRRRYPILFFEQVAGHDIPIVCNVVASRGALAFALGVEERGLAAEYARRLKDLMKPVVVPDPPFRHRVLTGPPLDLAGRGVPSRQVRLCVRCAPGPRPPPRPRPGRCPGRTAGPTGTSYARRAGAGGSGGGCPAGRG